MAGSLSGGHYLAGINGGQQWATSQPFSVGDVVWKDGYPIRCLTAHTSGTFATDVTNNYWELAYRSKNYIINGSMDIWQRGTSISVAAGVPVYTADRMYVGCSAGTSITVSQAPSVPAGSTYSLRATSVGNGKLNNLSYALEADDVNKLKGKQVTFSVKLRNSPTGAFCAFRIGFFKSATANQNTNTGSWSIVTSTTYTPTSSGAFTLSVSTTVPNDGTANGFAVFVDNVTGGTFVTGDLVEVTQMILSEGPAPAPFQTAGANIAEELAMCQRYYNRPGFNDASSVYFRYGVGQWFSAVTGEIQIHLPIAMRKLPTLTTSTITKLAVLTSGGTSNNLGTLFVDGGQSTSGADVHCLGLGFTSTGGAAGNATQLLRQNDVTAFIAFDAEL